MSVISTARRGLDERLPSPEALLLDFVTRCERHREDRRGVHIHISRLKPHHRREQHRRIAVNTFESLVRAHDGQIFVLANGDIVFIAKNASIAEIDKAVLKLRYLFAEDPLVHLDAGDSDPFCTWYELEDDFDDLLARAGEILAAATREKERAIAGPAEPEAIVFDALDAGGLARLEAALAQADLSALLHRRHVAAVIPKLPPQRILQQVRIDPVALAETLAPGIDLRASRWLFQHLTQTLDRRLLALLPRHEDAALKSRIGINLNVSTLLSPDFLAFDGTVRAAARGTVMIELSLVDVLADIDSFHFAREFVRERGYKLCLDGLTDGTAALFDREKLGFDLFRVRLTPAIADGASAERLRAFGESAKRAGEARVILAGVDTPESLTLGQKLGFSLFEGRAIDDLLQPPRKKA
jgi:EAL domain-containing protein (putative c-di-GMP-specific phosphodiesterase class I)